MRRLWLAQQITGVLCFGFVGLIIAANLSCAPKYFQRGDVLAGLAIGLLDAVLLLGASSGESDTHRLLGVTASASAATLFLATASIPVLFAPVAIAGAFRLPRSGRQRATALIAVPLAIVGTAALLFFGQGFVTADQFRCP
jgi:succinate dehydrogenase hydrophobic anchor subunit